MEQAMTIRSDIRAISGTAAKAAPRFALSLLASLLLLSRP